MNDNHKLSPLEQNCLDSLAGAWNDFLKLEHANPDMVAEFRHGIHALQNEIMARPTRRLLDEQGKTERLAAAIARKAKDSVPRLRRDHEGEWLVDTG